MVNPHCAASHSSELDNSMVDTGIAADTGNSTVILEKLSEKASPTCTHSIIPFLVEFQKQRQNRIINSIEMVQIYF